MSRLILASSSPRRRELLAQAGYVFEVRAAHIPEEPREGEEPIAYVTRLAREKAEAVFREQGTRDRGNKGSGNREQGAESGGDERVVVLGADTTVTLDGQILEKPRDAEDAKRMLRMLSGRTHRVITGVAVVSGGGAGRGSGRTADPSTALRSAQDDNLVLSNQDGGEDDPTQATKTETSLGWGTDLHGDRRADRGSGRTADPSTALRSAQDDNLVLSNQDGSEDDPTQATKTETSLGWGTHLHGDQRADRGSGRTADPSTALRSAQDDKLVLPAHLQPDRVEVAAEVTTVQFLALSEEEIAAYVASGEPMDKAGAYGIQGLAAKWIPRIEGCYFNVVGLPLALVGQMLKSRE